MIQVISLATPRAGYGGNYTAALSVNSELSWAGSGTFHEDFTLCPIASPGIFKNLYVYAPQALSPHADFSIFVRKNKADTILTAAVTGDSGSDTIHTVHFSKFDNISYRYSGPGDPGFHCFLVVEFVPDDASDISIYGVNLQAPRSDGSAGVAGAFSNAYLQFFSWPPTFGLSSSYSISSLSGNVTNLVFNNDRGDLGSVTVQAWIRLNEVIQDGSPGTVDTTITITGNTANAESTFTLPIVPGDHVEYIFHMTGGDLPFSFETFSIGCTVVSDDGTFILCGGTGNNAASNTTPNYIWNRTEQIDTEIETRAPVGISGLNFQGLYVEHTDIPGGTGKGWIDTLRKNGVDTTLTVTVLDPNTTGLILGDLSFSLGDLVNLSYIPLNIPSGAHFYWGLKGLGHEPLPPPPDVENGDLSGIYFLSPGKKNDTIYENMSLNTTTHVITSTTAVVAIPNPYIYSALLGDE